MQKIIFVSESVREEVEEYMRSSEGLFCSDYVDYCQTVADEFNIGASDAECIYDEAEDVYFVED